MTAGKPGRLSVISSSTKASRERTLVWTANSIRGYSAGCGIWSRIRAILKRFTPESRMPRCSVHAMAGLRTHSSGAYWHPGAGGLCLHTILLDETNPARLWVAISAAGVFGTTDGGRSWQPLNRGLQSSYLPNPEAEIGHCVHRIARHPARPQVLYMQKHWDVMRSDDGGARWQEVSGNLPSDFGFALAVHAHEPETVYVVPIKSDSEHFPPDGRLRVYRSRTGGHEWEALTRGLPQEHCYVNVLRGALAVDALEPCGLYMGTTGGQVYASADAGETWQPIVRDLPAVLSVEVQTLP